MTLILICIFFLASCRNTTTLPHTKRSFLHFITPLAFSEPVLKLYIATYPSCAEERESISSCLENVSKK